MYENHFNKRFMIIFFIFLFLMILLVLNLARIQIINSKYWAERAYKQYYRNEELVGKRGSIIAQNGEKIAYDIESYDLTMDPRHADDFDIDKIVRIFASNLELEPGKLKNDILEKKHEQKRYIKIQKEIDAELKNKIAQELKAENLLVGKGIYFMETTTRFYPKRDLFVSVAGYVNAEKKGVFGVEGSLDKYLLGEKGYHKKYVSTHIEFELPMAKKGEMVKPEDGKTVVLTIDYVIQHILEEEMRKMFNETGSEWAAGIILEPDTGKILAMVSLPVENDNAKIRNNFIHNQYEPGSVMKPLIVAMALEENLIKDDEIIYSGGNIKVFNATIREHDSSTKGYFTLKDVIAKSSNVAMVKIGEKFSRAVFYEYMKKYGFGELTGIDLTGEKKPYLSNYKYWSGVTQATMSFGQGIAVTPIEMAMAFSALINGGVLYKPLLIDRVEDKDGNILVKYNPIIKNRVISNETSFKVKKMMEEVVVRGTATSAKIEGYTAGGKTGTSQKSGGKKGYLKGKYISSFAGFYPVENPKYFFLALYDEPKGKKVYGGQIAAPVFRESLKRILKYKNILPENITTKTIYLDRDIKDMKVENLDMKKNIEEGIIPDFKGKSLRDVLDFFSNYEDVAVNIKGNGMVKNQSIKPGSNVKNINEITIILEEKQY